MTTTATRRAPSMEKDFRAMSRLLKKDDRWTKGENARTIDGSHCEPGQKGAHCFCLAGAMMQVAGSRSTFNHRKMLDGMAQLMSPNNGQMGSGTFWSRMEDFNDHGDTTIDDVIVFLDTAIGACKAAGV